MTQLLYKWSRGKSRASALRCVLTGAPQAVACLLQDIKNSQKYCFFIYEIFTLSLFLKGKVMEKMKNITIKVDEKDWEIFKIITKKILGSDASKEIRKFIKYMNNKYDLEIIKYSATLKEIKEIKELEKEIKNSSNASNKQK